MKAALTLLAFSACATFKGGGASEDFVLQDLSGNSVRLSDHSGSVVLVPFWATWCVPCAAELQQAERLYNKYKDRGLVVLAISTDGPTTEAQVASFVARQGLTFPVLLDPNTRVFERYQPKGVMPFYVIFDRGLKKQAVHEGYAPGDEEEIERTILSLL